MMKVFTIRDSKAECYYQPFFKRSHGEAERDFTALVRDPKSSISQFPDDFDLYYLGEYDDQNGTFAPLDTPQHVLKAINVKPQ